VFFLATLNLDAGHTFTMVRPNVHWEKLREGQLRLPANSKASTIAPTGAKTLKKKSSERLSPLPREVFNLSAHPDWPPARRAATPWELPENGQQDAPRNKPVGRRYAQASAFERLALLRQSDSKNAREAAVKSRRGGWRVDVNGNVVTKQGGKEGFNEQAVHPILASRFRWRHACAEALAFGKDGMSAVQAHNTFTAVARAAMSVGSMRRRLGGLAGAPVKAQGHDIEKAMTEALRESAAQAASAKREHQHPAHKQAPTGASSWSQPKPHKTAPKRSGSLRPEALPAHSGQRPPSGLVLARADPRIAALANSAQRSMLRVRMGGSDSALGASTKPTRLVSLPPSSGHQPSGAGSFGERTPSTLDWRRIRSDDTHRRSSGSRVTTPSTLERITSDETWTRPRRTGGRVSFDAGSSSSSLLLASLDAGYQDLMPGPRRTGGRVSVDVGSFLREGEVFVEGVRSVDVGYQDLISGIRSVDAGYQDRRVSFDAGYQEPDTSSSLFLSSLELSDPNIRGLGRRRSRVLPAISKYE